MAYELKEGQGSLFRNADKEHDKQPDYKGKIMIGGVEYRLSAWIKEGQSVKWLSIQASEKGKN